MVIKYTLLFIFDVQYFFKIIPTFEYIQGSHPDSGNWASVALSY